MEKAVVTIYTKPGCHLCDEAKDAILGAGCAEEFVLDEIDIDTDSELKERYRYDIPVVLINGIKVFKHVVDAGEFKRKLRRIRDAGTGEV